MSEVFIIKEKAETEFTEKKSKFISIACPVTGQPQVQQIIKETRILHPDSRHVVWAYIVGNSRTVFGYSDDGEPGGTAGRPLFEVLKGSTLTDTLFMVIRYFGGIKLGTGGLVKAYTKAGQDLLEVVKPYRKIAKTQFSLSTAYSYYDQIKILISSLDGEIVNEEFSENIRMDILIPDEAIEDCALQLATLSAGKIKLERKDPDEPDPESC